MKRLLYFVLYSFLLLVIGRNVSYLPDFSQQSRATEQLSTRLLPAMSKILSVQSGNYSLFYKDIRTGEEFGINENRIATGASVNKLVIVTYLYHLAKTKRVNLEERVVIQKADIQDYGTGSIRYQKYGQAYTLKTLAQLSLEQSDNTAAHVLALKLGKNKIQQFADLLGLSATHMEDNKTTAKDMGMLLYLLYTQKLTSSILTRELLDFMKHTQFEDRLPKNLPSSISVYHKTGDGVGFVHDVGIIDDGKEPFILSILSSDVVKEDIAKQTIGALAKTAYEIRESTR